MRKYIWKKIPRNPVNKNLIKVRRNTSPQDPRKNYPKRRQSQPYTQISKVDMSSNIQIINTEKDLKISKNKFNRYGGQVGSRTSGKNIPTVWIVGQFDMGELGCGTSFFQHFGSSKFSDKYDAGPATWAHVNGYIDARKYTEIFRNNLHSRVSKG